MSQQTTKSEGVAYALWFFLGGLGAHRFYFGKKGSAFGMIGVWAASIILAAMIGNLGFLPFFGWWVYDAFQVKKWVEGSDAAPMEAGGFQSQPSTFSQSAPASDDEAQAA